MKPIASGFTRRTFLSSTALVGAVLPQAVAGQSGTQRSALGIDALGLDPAIRADIEQFAEPVLRETAYLAELPLDDISPAFVFVPPGEDR